MRALHDFLAENAKRLVADDDPLLRSAGTSPALEKYREERARLAEIDRLERDRKLISSEEMRMGLEVMAGFIRRASETLQRTHGQDAADIVNRAVDDFERMLDQPFGDAD